MNDIDQALNEIKDLIAKSAETNSTYTFSPATRSIFAPENLDEKIKFLVPTDAPLRNRLPRTKGFGQAAEWKMMTSNLDTGLTGTNTSIAFADAAAPGETTQTYSATYATYKLLGRKLEVGGLALAASNGRAGEPNMQDSREKVKMYEVILGEEKMIIDGDAATRTNEFSGLNKLITTNSGLVTFITASGIGDWARTLYGVGADPTVLVASARQLQALANDLEKSNSIMRTVITQGEMTGVTGGMKLSKIINPVTGSVMDVEASRYVGLGGLLLTEKSPAGESWIDMDELIPMSRVDVPSTTFSYTSFILEALALKLISEIYQYKFCVGA